VWAAEAVEAVRGTCRTHVVDAIACCMDMGAVVGIGSRGI
jgi:hypothetical protein